MLKLLFKITALAVGSFLGYLVWQSLIEFFSPYIAYGAAAAIGVGVFSFLYFLFGRPLADFIHHRMQVMGSRFRDNRSGTDIDIVPVTHYGKKHELVKCAICGVPGDPVCEPCKARIAGD